MSKDKYERLTPAELEAILKRADSVGISRETFIIPKIDKFGAIVVDGVKK